MVVFPQMIRRIAYCVLRTAVSIVVIVGSHRDYITVTTTLAARHSPRQSSHGQHIPALCVVLLSRSRSALVRELRLAVCPLLWHRAHSLTRSFFTNARPSHVQSTCVISNGLPSEASVSVHTSDKAIPGFY